MDALESESDNETEAETERLHISPQKPLDQLNKTEEDEDMEDEDEEEQDEEQEEDTDPPTMANGPRIDLRPQDLLSDEPEEDEQTSDDDNRLAGNAPRSPSTLAGHKRKRNGLLSPPTGQSSPDGQSPRKRSSVRRSFGLQAPAPTASDLEIEAAVDAAVSSSEDEADAIRKIETARHGSLTPAPDADVDGSLEEAQVEAEVEEAAEADNEEDEAETTAKTEDDRMSSIAYWHKQILTIEQCCERSKLMINSSHWRSFLRSLETSEYHTKANMRDADQDPRMYDERHAELSAELDLLHQPTAPHKDFMAMRQALDARRDEKQRLEQINLQYKIQNLQKKILATRAQMHCQHYQKVREIRDDYLERLNSDYCQIQRERRQFIRKEPHFTYKFETDKPKQVENQTKYNKEVSLLSGIARHKGFPGAPELESAMSEDVEGDFREMRVYHQYSQQDHRTTVC